MHHICMTYAYMQSYALYKQIYAHICRHGRHLQGICKAYASICKHSICKYMQAYASICKHMQAYASICLYKQTYARHLQVYALHM